MGARAGFRAKGAGSRLPSLLLLSLMCVSAMAGPPSDPAEFEAFVDGVMAAHRESHHFAGATIAVVEDGALFFSKGYGYADVASRVPVGADTLFRIGSVSKLLTWTAIMQLEEAGKLDLDADVNEYLDTFHVPATFPEPITLKHVMSHTSGFEDRVIGLFARDAAVLNPLSERLATELPARVRPPGEIASYSNHATAMAAYIVERVSGEDWHDYVESHILEPLGMTHTTTRQPVPPPLAGDLSKGYLWRGDRHEALGFEYVPLAPAGSVSSNAEDMAKFMLMHLGFGQHGGARVLGTAAAQRMRGRLFTPDQRMNGMLHGFYETSRNGVRIFGHGGDTFAFHSDLLLLPEHDFGLFVSYNTDTGAIARNALENAILDRYFPYPIESPAPTTELGRLTGVYGGVRHSYTTLAKLGALLMLIVVEPADEEGQLSFMSPFGPERYREIAPLLFQNPETGGRIAFRADAEGEITHLFVDSAPMIGFRKLAFYEAPNFNVFLVGVLFLTFALAILQWPWRAWRRRGTAETRHGLIGMAGWSASMLFVAFGIGLTAIFASMPPEVAFGIPTALKVLLWLPIVAVPFVAVSVVSSFHAWRGTWWTLGRRIHFTLVAFGGVAFLVWLNAWNLLGFHYP